MNTYAHIQVITGRIMKLNDYIYSYSGSENDTVFCKARVLRSRLEDLRVNIFKSI